MSESRIRFVLIFGAVVLAFFIHAIAVQAAPETINVTACVALDRDTNGFFASGIDRAVGGARVTVVSPDGSRHRAVTNGIGCTSVQNVPWLPEQLGEYFAEVELPADFAGQAVLPSPRSAPRQRVHFGLFRNGYVQFLVVLH